LIESWLRFEARRAFVLLIQSAGGLIAVAALKPTTTFDVLMTILFGVLLTLPIALRFVPKLHDAPLSPSGDVGRATSRLRDASSDLNASLTSLTSVMREQDAILETLERELNGISTLAVSRSPTAQSDLKKSISTLRKGVERYLEQAASLNRTLAQDVRLAASRVREAAEKVDDTQLGVVLTVLTRQYRAEELESRVVELTGQVDSLASLTPEAAQYLLNELRTLERRGRRQNVRLFLLGVVAGGGVTVLLHYLGLG
jgi:hypothetical protein